MLNPSQVNTLREGEPAARTRLDGLYLHRMKVSREFAFDHDSLLEGEGGSTIDFRPPERIFGDPEEPSCLSGTKGGRLSVPRREIHRMDRARVIGWQTVLDEDGRIGGGDFHKGDNYGLFAARNRYNHEGFVLSDDDTVTFAGRETPTFQDRTAFFVPYLEPGNYGAFLIRCLPLLLFLREARLPPFDFYIMPERTVPTLEAMRLLGLPERPIYSVREVSGEVFRTVHVVQGEPVEGFFDPLSADRLRTLAGPSNEIARPDRLYVSRSLTGVFRPSVRPLLNEPAVEALVAALGFAVIHAEAHSFQEQMRMFAHARTIAGPSGSGMLNAIFSPPGTAVIDFESFTYNVRQHAKVYSSTGKNYAFAFGRFREAAEGANWERAWEIPLPVVREAVTWALDHLGSRGTSLSPVSA